ncbi:MAG: TMAO reductase system periplasmic protein TorT [Paracoccus sp. (in: a-proteobacteria)]|nr:TMAO reductase system periplasmic protein TorT [Paracoccus sp. (in: a-proteobacteria)]
MFTCYAARLLGSIAFAVFLALPGRAMAEICVLVPHFKDEYWLSVGYGLEHEARAAGLELAFHEAGGYLAREHQIAQIEACAAAGAQAILIGAVTSDHPALLSAVAQAARTTPVFALVNELHSHALSGSIGVDWRDMGRVVGAGLAQLWPEGAGAQAVLMTGPPQSGWVAPLEEGLYKALEGSGVRIVAVYGADTGLREQFANVTRAFDEHPDMNILIGSATAIEAAMGHLAAHPDQPRPMLAASYVNHSIRRGLSNGSIAAAPFDDPQAQGRIALRTVARFLQTGIAPAQTGPRVRLIRAGDPDAGLLPLSPADYFPAIR